MSLKIDISIICQLQSKRNFVSLINHIKLLISVINNQYH
jgi:hypothetical protein